MTKIGNTDTAIATMTKIGNTDTAIATMMMKTMMMNKSTL
jgi:hypothetical protein